MDIINNHCEMEREEAKGAHACTCAHTHMRAGRHMHTQVSAVTRFSTTVMMIDGMHQRNAALNSRHGHGHGHDHGQ